MSTPPRPPAAGSSATVAPAAGGKAERETLHAALERGRRALLEAQAADGHWCWPLEADCTIPAEYVLMMHFVGEVDRELQRKLAAFLRAGQGAHGGWPLFHGGALDVSATVKAYWALKLAGDDPAEPHMRRAREALLARGGAARANVFTRIAMALFGHVPWSATPFLPVEIVLLPRWFPFHLSKVSYWSRTVMVPLAVLCSLKARAEDPTGTTIRELFVKPPEEERDWFPVRSRTNRLLLAVERAARRLEPLIPGSLRRRALRAAEAWFVERLNGEDGLGAIFPAMVNSFEALLVLGRPRDDQDVVTAARAIRRLVVEEEDRAWCQPCFSPIWDTGLVSLCLQELEELGARDGRGSDPATRQALERAHRWLEERQILDGPADWRDERPGLAPGGWAFEYANPHYPDLDDTALVVWALHRADPVGHARAVERAADWLRGMQSRNGGFASFDADNTHDWLNEIPFADHGALLDPPTADVSARCAVVFGRLGRSEDRDTLRRVLDYLRAEQEPDGSWFGRWGTNHVYGTWSVLSALEHVADPSMEACVRRAVAWLERVQRADGGWGESNESYWDEGELPERGAPVRSTPFQTAWALLALLAAGEGDSPAVRRGVRWLLEARGPDGLWESEEFTAPGFPRVFFLRYHGYRTYFPLWALARYGQVAGA